MMYMHRCLRKTTHPQSHIVDALLLSHLGLSSTRTGLSTDTTVQSSWPRSECRGRLERPARHVIKDVSTTTSSNMRAERHTTTVTSDATDDTPKNWRTTIQEPIRTHHDSLHDRHTISFESCKTDVLVITMREDTTLTRFAFKRETLTLKMSILLAKMTSITLQTDSSKKDDGACSPPDHRDSEQLLMWLWDSSPCQSPSNQIVPLASYTRQLCPQQRLERSLTTTRVQHPISTLRLLSTRPWELWRVDQRFLTTMTMIALKIWLKFAWQLDVRRWVLTRKRDMWPVARLDDHSAPCSHGEQEHCPSHDSQIFFDSDE